MKILILTEDRKTVAKALAEALGEKQRYMGPPSFSYQVGPYEILRDNTIEVDEAKADLGLLRNLNAQGFIDDSWDEGRSIMEISLPLTGHDGRTLNNLVRMLYSRAEIINKAIGCAGTFSIEDELITLLDESRPDMKEDFMKLWEKHKGKCSGLLIDDEKITFAGFPSNEDGRVSKAYMDLVSLMNSLALNAKRVNIEKPDMTNEKYSFRVWLIRLGMKGDDYKLTRMILLEKLSGHSAFRTKDQELAAKEKNKAARLAVKEGE